MLISGSVQQECPPQWLSDCHSISFSIIIIIIIIIIIERILIYLLVILSPPIPAQWMWYFLHIYQWMFWPNSGKFLLSKDVTPSKLKLYFQQEP